MLTDLALAYAHALRTDFMVFYERVFEQLEPGTAFVDNRHLHAVAESLRKVWVGESRRLIINVPPRSGKSLMGSVAFPAWVLGHDPRRRIICVSYSEDLAKTHAAAFRSVVTSEWFRRLFPAFKIARGGNRSRETVTTARGFRYAVSLGGPVLGRGADLIIGDDAMSPQAALSKAIRLRELAQWNTAHRTRLNQQGEGAIIQISQRLHQQDLVGSLNETGGWDRLVLPAVAPEAITYETGAERHDQYRREKGEVLQPSREPLSVLGDLKRDMGSMIFEAMYQQNPIPNTGNVIKRDWLQWYDDVPDSFDHKVASWDTASTTSEASSYSVGLLWGAVGADYYLLAIERGRWEFPELKACIIRTSNDWRPDTTLIEDTELGRSLASELRRTTRVQPELRRPRYDKEARLQAQTARFEGKQVFLPLERGSKIDAYVEELLAFPNGRNDDQVDATSQALDYLTARAATSRTIVRVRSLGQSARMGSPFGTDVSSLLS